MPASIPDLIAAAAATHGLPQEIVAAVVQVESGGNPWATRFEAKYPYLWDVNANAAMRTVWQYTPLGGFPSLRGCSGHTEWASQKTSWGLMQVMGAVARERGFRGVFLSQLCDPATGLDIGCKHLKHLYSRHHDGRGWKGVLAAYNAGSPTNGTGLAYAAKVLGLVKGAQG